MIIIDEYAEAKLIKSLESVKGFSGVERGFCIHFKLFDKKFSGLDSNSIHGMITLAVRNHFDTSNPEIYICEDGDVYILTPVMPSKFARMMINEVATQLNVMADDGLVSLHELEISANTLLIALEEKIEKRRTATAALLKRHEEEKARRRRQSILDEQIEPGTQPVAARRTSRTHAELMIIEDDPFTRRLVENVLKKDYSLTALSTADLALATYAALAPDVLFLDIDLPDVTGHELLERILTVDPQAYVVMLSGNADQANIMSAMKAGAKGFIGKPFNRDKLTQYINRCPTIKR